MQAEVLQAEQVLKEAVDARKASKKQAGRAFMTPVTRTVWDGPRIFEEAMVCNKTHFCMMSACLSLLATNGPMPSMADRTEAGVRGFENGKPAEPG